MTDNVRDHAAFLRHRNRSAGDDRFAEIADLIESMAAALRSDLLPEPDVDMAGVNNDANNYLLWHDGPLAEALKRMGEKDD